VLRADNVAYCLEILEPQTALRACPGL